MRPDKELVSRVARRYAASTLQLDLVAKAVRWTLDNLNTPYDVSPFWVDRKDENPKYEDEHIYMDYEIREWDYASRKMDHTYFVGAEVDAIFRLPSKMLAQVPPPQRQEFMVEVLNRVFYKMGEDDFMDNMIGWVVEDDMQSYEDNWGQTYKNFKLTDVDATKPKPGRVIEKGKAVILPFKISATFTPEYEIVVEDPDEKFEEDGIRYYPEDEWR